ncbi:hypothetical protein [Nocardia yamanashiensis]|uniref:hypothetical protein n=1 Tax=Nocardia yamanashiensis TaxID=209247 RepID=UPI0012FE256F|nr:hypothetical protein [Nocardia yamanashiensis]
MGTSSRSADVVDPGRGHVVPMFYMTDGEWIWPDAIAYYLTEHNIPIETDFLNYIRSKNYLAATPNEKQIETALAVITNESREESLREWRSDPEACIVRTKKGNEWFAAFAIDGRNYASRQEFIETVTTAFDLLNSMAVAAEFETGPVGPGEPVFKLPTWEEYRESVQDNTF